MRKATNSPGEKVVKDIKRATRKQYSSEEKIRIVPKNGLRIIVQAPDPHAQKIVDAVLVEDTLKYGDHNCVTFRTAPGVQQLRLLGSGRYAATENVVEPNYSSAASSTNIDLTDKAIVLRCQNRHRTGSQCCFLLV